MTRNIPLSSSEPIDMTEYVRIESGEVMSSEYSGRGIRLKASKETGKSIVTCDDYAVISSEAVLMMREVLNRSDMSNVLLMSITAKTDLNILFNNNIPHTNRSLQDYLRIKSEAMYINLIKRLMKVGVLYQIKGLIWGEVRVIYMINTYICRKRKVFENRVLEVFKKFDVEQ